MRHSRVMTSVFVSLAVLMGTAAPARAQFYQQQNLISDATVPGTIPDLKLVNAWGLTSSATSPWWISDNQTGFSTIFNAQTGQLAAISPVAVPSAPTGVVFSGGTSFKLNQLQIVFMFASEDGTISGWTGGPAATVVINRSTSGAIFKGLAIGKNGAADMIYATNFHAGVVEAYDSTLPQTPSFTFTDSNVPAGYAPFGIQNINGTLYVTFALQDENAEDDVPGVGHGFVDAFDTAGQLLQRIASGQILNSPWGLALAPDGFGEFGGDLLVGNFGDGRIHAFDITDLKGNGEAKHKGQLHSSDGMPLVIDGLWALEFGNGAAAGPKTTLFFTAGPSDEQHGLFGSITAAVPPGQNP